MITKHIYHSAFLLLFILTQTAHSQHYRAHLLDAKIQTTKEVKVAIGQHNSFPPLIMYRDETKYSFILIVEMRDTSLLHLRMPLAIIAMLNDKSKIVPVDSIRPVNGNVLTNYCSMIPSTYGWIEFSLSNPIDAVSIKEKLWEQPMSDKKSVYIIKNKHR